MTPPTTPPADLDFASIRQQYPAAFAMLCEWVATNGPGCLADERVVLWASVNLRRLFDFFDQQGVCCIVMPIALPVTQFWACVFIGNYANATKPGTFPARTAAESAAFMAAFGKLEDRLKQEQG